MSHGNKNSFDDLWKQNSIDDYSRRKNSSGTKQGSKKANSQVGQKI